MTKNANRRNPLHREYIANKSSEEAEFFKPRAYRRRNGRDIHESVLRNMDEYYSDDSSSDAEFHLNHDAANIPTQLQDYKTV